MSQNKDQKQNGSSSGGGFFASLAMGLSNLGSAVTKSVNGYCLKPNFFLSLSQFYSFIILGFIDSRRINFFVFKLFVGCKIFLYSPETYFC